MPPWNFDKHIDSQEAHGMPLFVGSPFHQKFQMTVLSLLQKDFRNVKQAIA